ALRSVQRSNPGCTEYGQATVAQYVWYSAVCTVRDKTCSDRARRRFYTQCRLRTRTMLCRPGVPTRQGRDSSLEERKRNKVGIRRSHVVGVRVDRHTSPVGHSRSRRAKGKQMLGMAAG